MEYVSGLLGLGPKPHALILARGGSKGIPRKNIKPLNGVPLLVYNVKAALASGAFDAVVVSSDDDEILAVAEKAGATPHKRSAESAKDTASSARPRGRGFFFSSSRDARSRRRRGERRRRRAPRTRVVTAATASIADAQARRGSSTTSTRIQN